VQSLIQKIPTSNVLDFRINSLVSLEAQSLAYIYVAMYILFFYESAANDVSSEDFSIDRWLETMQKHLTDVSIDTFGWYVLVIKFMKLKINMEHSIFFIFNLKARSRM
jgi:hypothetical protein